MNARPTVSVIVCTRDRADDFARLLPTLLASNPAPLEIVVIDQSVDNAATAALVDRASAEHSIRLVYRHSSSRGLSCARNEGIRLASGDVCAFTDDDCTASENWVGWIQDVFGRSSDLGVAFGTLAPIPHDDGELFVPGFRPARPRNWRPGRQSLLESGAGANMCIRREVFERVGLFDEALGAGAHFRSGEDSDFVYRVARAGYGVIHDPAGVITHWGARPWAGGVARRLIFDGYAAMGTVYAKHARRGDLVAIADLLKVALETMKQIVTSSVCSRRPVGAGRLAALARGAWNGWRFPFEAA